MTNDFSEIRHLLDLWYDGLTSPEQESQLIHGFGELPSGSIPEDLKPDHAIFSQLQPQVSVSAIDAQLAVENAIRRARKPLLLRISRTAIAIAAVTVILLATGAAITFLRPALPVSSSLSPLTARISDCTLAKSGQQIELKDSTTRNVARQAVISSKPARRANIKKRRQKVVTTQTEEAPPGYKTPSPEDASVMIAESWELMASLLKTTVDDASATAEAATRSASDDIQDAIRTSNNSIEQFHDITANIINSL